MRRYPVYVIDDDPEIVRSLCFLLRAEGFVCASNESAEEFLEELPDLEPGPILLDLRLGGMSGLDLQEELNKVQWLKHTTSKTFFTFNGILSGKGELLTFFT